MTERRKKPHLTRAMKACSFRFPHMKLEMGINIRDTMYKDIKIQYMAKKDTKDTNYEASVSVVELIFIYNRFFF